MATNNEVLFLVIPEYADWEFALLAPGLRGGGLWAPKYEMFRTTFAAGLYPEF